MDYPLGVVFYLGQEDEGLVLIPILMDYPLGDKKLADKGTPTAKS